jgi:hypothetical protein
MGTKTLYVKNEAIWKKAEELIQKGLIQDVDSVSQLVSDLIEKKVSEVEAIESQMSEGFNKLTAHYIDDDGNNRKIGFIGKWIVNDIQEDRESVVYYQNDFGMMYSVALTKNKQLFLLFVHKNSGEGGHKVYSDFEEMVSSEGGVPDMVASLVASSLNIDYEEFLDI